MITAPPADEIGVWVLASGMPGLNYVYPPSGKFPRMQLAYTNGAIIRPIKGRMDERLPQIIAARDLPTIAHGAMFYEHGPGYHYFLMDQNSPNMLADVVIKDAFQITNDAEYMITVFPALYKFETNREYLDRIELPSVTTKIHLAP